MSKRQKKILLYSTLAMFVIALIATISVFMFVKFGDETHHIEKIKDLITTSLITYSSGAFLIVKIVVFIFDEVRKNKKLKPQENLRKIINNGELKMENKKISKEYNINGFKFEVNEKKGIRITFDEVEIMGSEDFYNKLKAANNEFLERIRKTLQE